MRPIVNVCPNVGLKLENKPGSETFQPLRVGHGDLHLQWQPVYQDVLRSVGPFAAFFPQAIFEGNGDTVTFSHCEEGRDILSQTRPLGQGEAIPTEEWERLDSGFRQFKAIANRDGIPSDVRRFIEEFAYPSHVRFPEAFRIYKPHWYSSRRLFILWGLEPLGGASFVRPSPLEARGELAGRVETTEDKVMSWLGRALLVLLVSALLGTAVWWAIFALLPVPRADFGVPSPLEKELVMFENRTTHERVADFIDFGDVTYSWSFEGALPTESADLNPAVVWESPGNYYASLTAKRETVFGISRTSTAGPVKVTVRPLPPPPTPIPPKPVPGDQDTGKQDPGKKDSRKPVPSDQDTGKQDPSKKDSSKQDSGKQDPGKQDSGKQDPGKQDSSKQESGKQDSGRPGTTNPDTTETNPKPTPPSQQEPARFPVGSASVVWYGSRPYGINQPQQWVTLGVDAPPGYKVTTVTIAGKSRSYVGRFEQLVRFGDCPVEIEVVKEGAASPVPEKLTGGIRFNQPFEVLNAPGTKSSSPQTPAGPQDEDSPSEKEGAVDPRKVPDLSHGA